MSKRWRLGVLFLVLILLGSSACFLYVRQGVKVRVRNVGSETLYSMLVHVTGNSYSIGDLTAATTASVRVEPTGESHVEVEFKDGKGKSKRLLVGGYFERFPYHGTISVDLDSEKVLKTKSTVMIGF